MRAGGGKAKGAANERELCRKLSLWVSNGNREDLFWRSAMSGGSATVARRRGVKLSGQAGDISAIDPMGNVLTDRFYVETKHVKEIKLDLFLIKGVGPLSRFWRTARKEAREYRKSPLLVVRQNRMPTVLVCSPGAVTDLTDGALLSEDARVLAKHCEMWLFDDVLQVPFALQNDV